MFRPRQRHQYTNPQIAKIKRYFGFVMGLLIGFALAWILFLSRRESYTETDAISKQITIDVCTKQQWETGHYKDAIFIDSDLFSEQFQNILTNKDIPVNVYAREQSVLDRVVKELQAYGYQVQSSKIWTN